MSITIFPHNIDNTQSLYSCIPLALDISYMDNYMKYLDTPYGDCQIFTSQEVASNQFSYMNSVYPILRNSSEKLDKYQKQLPFNTLLIGPSYACKQVLNDFDLWGCTPLETNSLYPQKKSPSKNVSQNATKLGVPVTPKHWVAAQHPSVWAQATFTSVTVTTAFPQQLKKELRRIFDFPITLSPMSPLGSEEHNELAAWLTAIYALISARNLHRTVICHSRSWAHQLQCFQEISQGSDIDLRYWKELVSLPQIIPLTKYNKKIPAVALAQQISRYDMRKASYQQEKDGVSRIIGMSYVQRTLVSQKDFAKITKNGDIKISLDVKKDNVSIICPINPSTNLKNNMCHIAADILDIDLSNIHFIVSQAESPILPISTSYYPLLTNLLLSTCKKAKKKQKLSTTHSLLSQSPSLTKLKSSVSCVTEFRVNKYDRRLLLSKVTIILDVGYVSDPQFAKGAIEAFLFSTIFSLCGQNQSIDKNFSLHVEFLKNKTSSYTSSFTKTVYSAIVHATINAITENTSIRSFPTGGLDGA